VLFDYFTLRIFDSAGDTARELLMRTAFLPHVTAQAAIAFAGADAPLLLDNLCRRQLFTNRRTNDEWTYHPLFRAFLQAKATEIFAADKLTDTLVRSARFAAAQGLVEDAVALYLGAADWPGAVALILTHAQALLAAGRWQTLAGWINALPAQTVHEQPWLSVWRGAAQMPVAQTAARVDFERAYAGFATVGDTTGALIAVASILESFVWGWDDLHGADPWIEKMETLFARQIPLPGEIAARVFSGLLCVTFRQPQHRLLTQWLERAWEVFRATPEANARVAIAAFICAAHMWRGDRLMMERILAEVAASVDAPDVGVLVKIQWGAFQAQHEWLIGSFSDALATVRQALALAESSGTHIVDHLAIAQGAYAGLNARDLATAEEFAERMQNSVQPAHRLDGCHAAEIKSGVALLKGDYAQALNCAEAAGQLAVACGALGPLGVATAAAAQALLAQRQHARAQERFEQLRVIGNEMQSGHLLFAADLCQAWSLLQTGQYARACELLRSGFALGREQGYRIIAPWSLPEILPRLCATALDAGIETEYVQGLVRWHGFTPPDALAANWPWPIRIFTLGRFSVELDGKSLAFTRKMPKKPIALLKALIALGGRNVSEQQLADALWPDAEGDAARDALAVNLHRLRRLLQDSRMLVLHDGCISLDARYCWVDAWAFAASIERAKAAANGDRPAHLQQAAMLYQGPFLGEDAAEPWSLSLRERLRAQFVRANAELAGLHESGENLDAAIAAYAAAIEADPLAEGLYQNLMRCYARMGRRAEALGVYGRLSDTLATMLGIKPSQATQTLQRSLLE
jgi:DNA-binding SARP family transcriptional activator